MNLYQRLILNILIYYSLHSDYPVAPEEPETNYDTLSKYCSDIANWDDIKVGGANKFVPNLDKKSKHVLHYKLATISAIRKEID